MATYQPATPEIWQGRIDGDSPETFRWHQIVQRIDLANQTLPKIGNKHQGIALVGFCCDEGVRRNKGRVGAAAGPDAIRLACRNLPLAGSHFVLVDAGNIICDDGNLEEAQEMLGRTIKTLKQHNYLPIVLGGGHEMSWGTFSGLMQEKKGTRYGAINFDAHFDLREKQDALGNTSGTPFWQMQQWCSQQRFPFHYLAIGIQQYSNTQKLFHTADAINAKYFLAEQFTNDQLESLLFAINGVVSNSSIVQLSIDMDVFASCHAPGVSAPSYNGIAPNSMFKRLLRHVIFSGKIQAIDIAEVNPTCDLDNRTARLAAAIVFDIVQAADMNAEFPA